MSKEYQGLITDVSNQIASAFLEKETNLVGRALLIDGDLAEITRQIGMETTKIVSESTLGQCAEKKNLEGLRVHRNSVICFNTTFGQIELNSPYLWNNGKMSKPLIDEMKITHHGRSVAVERALSDFGSEESFAQAAKRFEEHYKYDCSASTVSRVTKQIAEEAREYVEKKLSETGSGYGQIDNGLEKLLIEMDGCLLRTGVSKLSETSKQTTPVYGNPKKEKEMNWRDVRIGFARPSEAVSKIYVGKMDSYPEVVGQLFNASILVGMSPRTQVIGIADGG